jgi:type IV pilus assembly protein PilN
MRNIEASPWLENPGLVEVKAAVVDNKRVSQFELNLAVKRAEKEEAKDGAKGAKGAKPAAKRG